MKITGNQKDLTEGPIVFGILTFAIPMFLGQLLQQLYNIADAWVVGNFADNNAFAAVSSTGSMIFLIVGFFSGVSIGGGVIISKYFGAKQTENVKIAVHTNIIMGIISSVIATIVGVLIAPKLLLLMKTPADVLPESTLYLRIYFAGVSTIVMYNIGMSVMRALGDSIHPLYYLAFSSIVNIVLDVIFVAWFKWGVAGAAIATVISQGLSALMCMVRLMKEEGPGKLERRYMHYYPDMMKEVVVQGLPTGIQNSVISIGNVVVQTNINSFGAFAMSGAGAYSKIEGFAFLPITSMSMSLPTFIGQNLGAKKYDRAKKGAFFGILSGVVVAELIGVGVFLFGKTFLGFFTEDAQALSFGVVHTMTVPLFYCLLAYSHCAAGVLRGCGKSVVPMATMLFFWCAFRIAYVTFILRIIPQYRMICTAYPITWTGSTIVFTCFLLFSDWTHAFEKVKDKERFTKK